VLAVYVAAILVDHVPALGVQGYLPRQALLPARILKLNQQWRMFAPDPLRFSAVLYGTVKLRSGEVEHFETETSARWKFYARGLYNPPAPGSRRATKLHYLGRYFCRTWPRVNPGRSPVGELAFFSRQVRIYDGRTGPTIDVPIYTTPCESTEPRRSAEASPR